MRQQLQRYPMDQQRQLASGARAFVEHFRYLQCYALLKFEDFL